jgi:RNA polymerase sigma-70 factor (ECF subfamily)
MQAAPGPPDDDARLVARFRDGDDSAFDQLVLRHRRSVYRLAYRLMGGHAEADDLSQEAFLRAYRGLRRFRGEARFGTWLTRIVVNLALDARKARRPHLTLDELRSEDVAGASPPRAGGPPEAALRREVRQAVRGLAPRQMQVILMKVYEGLTFVEIARAAGISTGTAKATFFQAVQVLKARLAMPPASPRAEEEP